jgi:hypothetical protein
LVKDNWPEWLAQRIDALVAPDLNGCYISAQIQCFGGKHSKFTTNATNGTAYSWRDSTMCCTLDAFYDGESARKTAVQWHKRNDEEGSRPEWRL